MNAEREPAFIMGGLFAIDANGVLTDKLTYSFQPIKDNIIGVTVTLVLNISINRNLLFPAQVRTLLYMCKMKEINSKRQI